jgi:hypothetical protein
MSEVLKNIVAATIHILNPNLSLSHSNTPHILFVFQVASL